MNDRPSDHELDDLTIERLLASLKQLEPPLESRIANRAAVAAEITRLTHESRAQHLPFWRRRVLVPWPVAAAAVAMLIMLSLISFQVGRHVALEADTSAVGREDVEVVDQPGPNEGTPVPEPPALAYHETTTYLCGIGPLRSEARYVLEE